MTLIKVKRDRRKKEKESERRMIVQLCVVIGNVEIDIGFE
jgi:hypothetical protein